MINDKVDLNNEDTPLIRTLFYIPSESSFSDDADDETEDDIGRCIVCTEHVHFVYILHNVYIHEDA